MLTMFAVLFFALVVDRDAVVQLRIFELIAGYLIILTATELGFTLGTFIAVPLMLAATWFGLRVMERSEKTVGVFYGLGLLVPRVRHRLRGGRQPDTGRHGAVPRLADRGVHRTLGAVAGHADCVRGGLRRRTFTGCTGRGSSTSGTSA